MVYAIPESPIPESTQSVPQTRPVLRGLNVPVRQSGSGRSFEDCTFVTENARDAAGSEPKLLGLKVSFLHN